MKFDNSVTNEGWKTDGSPSHNFGMNGYHVSSEFSSISTPRINIVCEDVVNDSVHRKKRKECKVMFTRVPCGMKTTKVISSFHSLFFGQRVRYNSETIW